MNGKRKILTYEESLEKRQNFCLIIPLKFYWKMKKNEIFDLASYETPSI